MRILQIKQAECALADGRLDEAYELAVRDDLRSHRNGQKLIGRLVQAMIDRGRRHEAAGHTRQALADCEKAERLGGNLPEIAEIRSRVAQAVARQQQSRRRHGDLVESARRHIEDGRLSLGEHLLADVSDDSARTEQLRHEAAARRNAAVAALSEAAAALRRGDYAASIDQLLAARANRADSGELADLTGRVVSASTSWIHQEIVRGRPDLADSLLRRLQQLADDSPRVEELARIMDGCWQAWRQVQEKRHRRAAETLRLVEAMIPEAKWLTRAVASAEKAAEAAESLRAGPLGMLWASHADPAETLSVAAGEAAERARPRPTPRVEPGSQSVVPLRFLLQVDGAGGFYVLRQARVTIGPISSAHRPELGLMADPSLPVITIERSEGDYFLRSEAAVHVNDKPTNSKLLADGDRIALSPRCRMRFRLPNAASTSAVLELTGTRLPQADARRVILLDREMIAGPGPSAHIRSPHLPAKAVLYLKDGRLLCRTDSKVMIDRQPVEAPVGIPIEKPVRVGPVGMVVTRV